MPASLTKRDLSTVEIEAMLTEAFGPQAVISGIEEFTEGYFASVYGVRVAVPGEPAHDLVLKVAAQAGPHLLRYEADLLAIEAEFFSRAAAGGVAVPALRHVDPRLRFLVMDRLAGTSLAAVRDTMPPEQLTAVRRQLGAACARLHAVTGDQFGYPRPDGRTRSKSWRESFLAIVDDILADAVDYDVPLPLPAAEIRSRLAGHGALLDQVDTPRLVHFDLWDGNVFVASSPDGWQLTGLIDGERAFYGDPIAELVSLAMFVEPADVPGVLPGLLGRQLSADERVRLRLYNVYLLLILVTESGPRGWTHPEQLANVARWLGMLAGELELL